MKRNGDQHTRKKLRWDPKVTNRQAENHFKIFKQGKNISTGKLRDILLPLIDRGLLEELHSIVVNLHLDEDALDKFFSEQAESIINESLIAVKINVLAFVSNYIPRDLAENILRKEDFVILKKFFTRQKFLEQMGVYSDSKKKQRIEQLTELIRMSPTVISEFMQQHGNESYMTDRTRAEYHAALALFQRDDQVKKEIIPRNLLKIQRS